MRRGALRALALVLAIAPTPTHGDDWTATDTALEMSFAALYVADWSQTSWTLGQRYEDTGRPRYHENNPLLGLHPSRRAVNAYFLSGLVLHPVVSWLLPRPWRTFWQGTGIALEAWCIGTNMQAGIRFALP